MSKSIQERLKSLERQYKGLCCKVVDLQNGGEAGCISFTDITWTEFITQIENGSIADCYYNITDRPNSGTDPLYVLVEKGLPDFDNEVRRGQQALASFCLSEKTDGTGCYNIYAESGTTFEITPAKCYLEIPVDQSCFEEIQVGSTITGTVSGQVGVVTGINIKDGFIYFADCPKFEKRETILIDDTILCATKRYNGIGECKENLQVGMKICSTAGEALITFIDANTISVEYISGTWIGISSFWPCEQGPTSCVYTMPPIPVPTSTPLNAEPICFSKIQLGKAPFDAPLMLASDGNLYGTVSQGGKVGHGQLYTVNPTTEVVTILYEFDFPNSGTYPHTSLVEIAGELFGTTAAGGVNDRGTIFKYDITTQSFTILHSFDGTLGSLPRTGLTNVGGVLYGVTLEGGPVNQGGVLFSFDPSTNTFNFLKDLGAETILYPQGDLVEVLPGKLWGTSYNGGNSGYGTVFEYEISTGDVTIISNLDTLSLSYSQASGGVFKASDNNVYFQVIDGGQFEAGALLRITNVGSTNNLELIFDFDETSNTSSGAYPEAVKPIEIGGILYGVTPQSSINGGGVIWSYELSSNTFNVEYIFTDEGLLPYSSLFAIGNVLYGTTNASRSESGKFEVGCIFKYDLTTSTFTPIEYFDALLGNVNDIALITCAGLDNPAYTCTVIDGCVFITGTQYAQDNNVALVVKTVYTLFYVPDTDDPVEGNTLTDGGGTIFGHILDVDPILHTMKVEWDFFISPDNVGVPFLYGENETANTGQITDVIGRQVVYTSTPFTGGDPFPRNVPCYYNAKLDIIVDYPMSQPFTKTEIQQFIADSTLVPGAFYYIKNLDTSLYGGTVGVFQATSGNTLNPEGMALFYTPKYRTLSYWNGEADYNEGDRVIWGGQIWTNITGETGSSLSSYNLDTVNWTNGGDRSLIFVNPISLSGGTFNVGDSTNISVLFGTGNILELVIENDKVSYIIIDGYFDSQNWIQTITDTTTGAIIDVQLDRNWDYNILPNYLDADYVAQWDLVTYDQDNDFFTSRQDLSLNYVEQSHADFLKSLQWGIARSLKAFKWGFGFDSNSNSGFYENKIYGGLVELLNSDFYTVFQNEFRNSYLTCPLNKGGSTTSLFYNVFLQSTIGENTYIGSPSIFYNHFLNSRITSSDIGGPIDRCSFYNTGLSIVTNSNISSVIFNNASYSGNLIGATHIYDNSKSLEVITAQGGTVRVRFVDSAGNLVTALITA